MSHRARKIQTLPPYSLEREERSAIRSHRLTPRGTYVERNARINLKVQLAKVVISQAPQNDRRARLLRMAILRRDEVLLDELMNLGPREEAAETA